MLKTKSVAVFKTDEHIQVRVLHTLDAPIDSDAVEAMRRLASSVVREDGCALSLSAFVLETKEKTKASRLYRDSVKWSTRRAHRLNMPMSGWFVNIEDNKCSCAMHLKFGICSHVVVARK
eukprot:jgi/Phyca11/133719/e_gw1.671.1.1